MNERAKERGGARAAQKRETRDKILNSALHEFSERGFEGASIRSICDAAGVKHGLVKYHFNNKEELWKEAVDFLFERLFKEMAEPQEEQSLPRNERVRLWIHRYVSYCARHPEHARIMVQESIRDSSRLRWAADKYIREQHQRLIDTLPVTLDLRRFPAMEMSTLVYTLNAAMQAPFTLAAEVRQVHGTKVDSDKFVFDYAENMFDIFFRPYLAVVQE